jgi:hypothetical protein
MVKKLKLITEHNENIKFIKEEKGEKGVSPSYYIQGIYMQAETVNKNLRVYPLNVLEKEVKRYNEEYVKKGRALGELGHPEGPQLNLERVSHKIIELKMDGNNVMGKAKILDTPYGKITKNFIDEGIVLGVSSRALGSLVEREDGISEVSEDFELSTVDIVADPSAPEAFVNGIMENREWVYENGIVKAVEIERYKKQISKTHRKKLEEQTLRIFEDFLKKLKNK